jgi:hypothetical protein
VDEDNMVLGDLRPTGIVPAFYKTLRSKGIDIPIEVFGE